MKHLAFDITTFGTLAALALAAPACGDDAAALADGTLAVSIYGEAYIEESIPADVFSDGWTVTFAKFLVVAGELEAARGHDDDAPFRAAAYKVHDVATPSAGAGQSVVSAAVPGGTYDHLGFRVKPVTDAVAGNASADDVAMMNTMGWSIYVEGVAVKGELQKQFFWGFDTDTTYSGCHTAALVDGGTGASQITVHGDHLFYDDLASETPNVSFDLVAAADTDADGEVEQAELMALDLRTQERYQVGSFPVTDLWAFVRHQTSTVGHIDGEGHCDAVLAE